MRIRKVSVYVLNYNGASLLPECLPSLVRAQSEGSCETRLLVIDNCSTDKSLEVLRGQFSVVPVLEAPSNRYLCSFNDYVFKDDADIVILMNNDVKVETDFIDPLVKLFEEQENAFMASPLCFNFSDSQFQGGLSVLQKKFGWWGTRSVDPRTISFPYTVSMGACIAFHRNRFVALGGFDDLFLPGILEDLDICYRGWKQGWKGYVVPKSIIYHKGQASFKEKFGESRIRTLAVRNTLLFIWKNIFDPFFLLEHFFLIGPRIFYAILVGDFSFVKGCFQAFLVAPSAFSKRAGWKLPAKLSDRDICDIFRQATKAAAIRDSSSSTQ